MLDAKMENRDGIDGDEMLSTPKMATMAAGFMIEGFETITNLLSFTSYLLAMHPEVQEKLQSEIDEWFANNPVSFTHNNNYESMKHVEGNGDGSAITAGASYINLCCTIMQ